MTAHCHLQAIPNELLSMIFDLLYDEKDLTDFINLALTSRHALAVATPIAHRTIRLVAKTPKQFERVVRQCRQHLKQADAFSHVRRLVIQGNGLVYALLAEEKWASSGFEIPIGPDDEWSPSLRQMARHAIDLERPVTSRDFRRPWFEIGNAKPAIQFCPWDQSLDLACPFEQFEVQLPQTNTDWYAKAEASWRPLASLLAELSGLSDLHFSCFEQFPPCLLNAVHRYRPQCRLHLHNFMIPGDIPSFQGTLVPNWLIRLSGPAPAVETEDAEEKLVSPNPMMTYEKSLLSSPSLHRIDVWTLWRVSGVLIMQNLWSAPNLQEVSISRCALMGEEDLELEQSVATMIEAAMEMPRNRFALRVLELHEMQQLPLWYIQAWSRHTDFHRLETLKLEHNWGITLEALTFLLTEYNFLSLTPLSLSLPPSALLMEEGGSHCHFCSALKDLSNSHRFPVLTTLRLSQWDSQYLLDGILPPNIRNLALFGGHVTSADLSHIRITCPRLEDLRIPICRSKGSFRETKLYTELSLFQHLRFVEIEFYHKRYQCRSVDEGPDGSYSEFERQRVSECVPFGLAGSFPGWYGVQNGHVMDDFANAAIDAKLVRSIFDIISGGTQRLERLKITTTPNLLVEVMESASIAEDRRSKYRTRGDLTTPYHLGEFMKGSVYPVPDRFANIVTMRSLLSLSQIINNIQRDWVVTRNPLVLTQDGRQQTEDSLRIQDCSPIPRGWDREGKLPLAAQRESECPWLGLYRHVWPAPKDDKGEEIQEAWPWAYESLPLQMQSRDSK